MSARTVEIPEDLAERADRLRRDVPLSLYVRRVLERAVIEEERRAGVLTDEAAGEQEMRTRAPRWRHTK